MALTGTDKEFSELERKLVEQENVSLRSKLATSEQQVRDLQLETTRLFNAQADDINPNVQMDRALGIPHFNYGLHQVSAQVDATRRLKKKTREMHGADTPFPHEAVSIIVLNAQHYAEVEKKFGVIYATNQLIPIVKRIEAYVNSNFIRKHMRASDEFAKASFQPDEFLIVLPATDVAGAKTVVDNLRSGMRGIDGTLCLSYGIANYASDVSAEIDLAYKEQSARSIAYDLICLAKQRAKQQSSQDGLSGILIEQEDIEQEKLLDLSYVA